MDTHALQAFLAVADTGSFSGAAERLFLTQPAVSKRIAALESELDARLFDRLGRRVIPTEAGRTLLPKARHIIQELEDGRRRIANLQHEVGGTLQMATSHHIGLHRLPGVLRRYTLRYPQVELDIGFMDSEAGCEAVLAGAVELAVVTLPDVPAEQLQLTTLWDDPLSIMVAGDHPLAHATDPLQALSRYPAILPEQGTFTRRLIEQPLAARGVELKVGLQTNYLETIRMLVAVGLGWSVLPLSMYKESIYTDALRCLEPPGVQFHRTLGIVTHRARTLSKAARALQDTLLQTTTDRTGSHHE